MEEIKLSHEIYKSLYILTKEEFSKIGKDYKCKAVFDPKVNAAFLPGKGTILFYENKHFLIIDDKKPQKNYAIWNNHNIIGYCTLNKEAAEKANRASNAIFYFGIDKETNPGKYN